MSHRYIHLLEKLQVEFAAVLAAVGVYFLVAPHLLGTDPELPITFLADGNYAGLALLACTVWVVAAGCTVLTVSARPEGAVLAALMGTAGVSLYSPPIRALLWYRDWDLSGVFAQFRLEVLLFLAVLVVAMVVVALVRGAMARLTPGWLWRSPLAEEPDEEPVPAGKAKGPGRPGQAPEPPKAGRLGMIAVTLESLGILVRGRCGAGGSRRAGVATGLSFFGLGLLIAVVCLLLLMRSPQRGQILFALVTSFVLAALIAHQVFPAACSIMAWLMPIATALILYTLASASIVSAGAQAWMAVPAYSRALPIDWLTAGCGGAVLGYWISQRIHEARNIEADDESEEGA